MEKNSRGSQAEVGGYWQLVTLNWQTLVVPDYEADATVRLEEDKRIVFIRNGRGSNAWMLENLDCTPADDSHLAGIFETDGNTDKVYLTALGLMGESGAVVPLWSNTSDL